MAILIRCSVSFRSWPGTARRLQPFCYHRKETQNWILFAKDGTNVLLSGKRSPRATSQVTYRRKATPHWSFPPDLPHGRLGRVSGWQDTPLALGLWTAITGIHGMEARKLRTPAFFPNTYAFVLESNGDAKIMNCDTFRGQTGTAYATAFTTAATWSSTRRWRVVGKIAGSESH